MGSLGQSVSQQGAIIEPCHFPSLTSGSVYFAQGGSEIDIEVTKLPSEVISFCIENGIDISAWVKTGWAIVLSAFTGTTTVTFGTTYMSPDGSNSLERAVFSVEVNPGERVHELLRLIHNSRQPYKAIQSNDCFEIDCDLSASTGLDFNTQVVFNTPNSNNLLGSKAQSGPEVGCLANILATDVLIQSSRKSR